MADTVLADTNVDAEDSSAPERNGHSESQHTGTSKSSTEFQPIPKDRLQAALDAIPKDRDREMIADFEKAVASESREQILAAMLSWVGMGDFHAGPDRVKNHPLASLAGAFKDDPGFEEFTKQIALARCLERSSCEAIR